MALGTRRSTWPVLTVRTRSSASSLITAPTWASPTTRASPHCTLLPPPHTEPSVWSSWSTMGRMSMYRYAAWHSAGLEVQLIGPEQDVCIDSFWSNKSMYPKPMLVITRGLEIYKHAISLIFSFNFELQPVWPTHQWVLGNIGLHLESCLATLRLLVKYSLTCGCIFGLYQLLGEISGHFVAKYCSASLQLWLSAVSCWAGSFFI